MVDIVDNSFVLYLYYCIFTIGLIVELLPLLLLLQSLSLLYSHSYYYYPYHRLLCIQHRMGGTQRPPGALRRDPAEGRRDSAGPAHQEPDLPGWAKAHPPPRTGENQSTDRREGYAPSD